MILFWGVAGIWLFAILLAGVIWGINRVLARMEQLEYQLGLLANMAAGQAARAAMGARTAQLERGMNMDLADLPPALRTAVAFIRAVRRG